MFIVKNRDTTKKINNSPTSSGDQLIPCLSRCVVNQTLICSSGCFDAAVSHESSACVG